MTASELQRQGMVIEDHVKESVRYAIKPPHSNQPHHPLNAAHQLLLYSSTNTIQGSGGGPLESNTTAFLVRSLSSSWTKGSLLAVDAGNLLSGIQAIIETTQDTFPGSLRLFDRSSKPILPQTLISGPFVGLSLPFFDAKANAGHIVKTLVDTYLITHPHLDHISGLVVNTACLPGTRQKRIAALPSTIHAFKQHIFNNVIWPNLTDENEGAGLVTYMRLVEGGAPALGFAPGREAAGLGPAGPNGARGYVEIAEGLSVKTWSVSHGHCMENHWHRGSSVALHGFNTPGQPPTPALNQDHLQDARQGGMDSPYRRQSSMANQYLGLGAYGGNKGYQSPMPYFPSHQPSGEKECVYDSSAYFIRDIGTGSEVLIFGDVEPDSLSLSPRNHRVWEDAAPKVAAKTLRAIFIECSYDERQSDDTLFGHLCPRFLMEELQALATKVALVRHARAVEKRQRDISRGRSDEHKRKRVSGSMIGTPDRTPTQGSTRHSRRSRETSPLGQEMTRDGDGYVEIRPTRRDFVHQASPSIDTSSTSAASTPDPSREESVSALLLESATRRNEMRKWERNRLHRQSSSVSPHSRPMRRNESLNGMNMEVFELDDHAPSRARIGSAGHRPQRAHSGPSVHSRPGSGAGFGEWSATANTTTRERGGKDSVTIREENEGSGDATPMDGRSRHNSATSTLKQGENAKRVATSPLEFRGGEERRGSAHISPHQTLAHNSLGASHEPSSGHLLPSKRSDSSITTGDRPPSINTARANRDTRSNSATPRSGNQHGDDGARSPIIEAIRNSEMDHSDVRDSERRLSTVGMLRGLKIVIIHVKERLDDGEPAGEVILRELREYEKEEGLGVEFVLSERGLSVWV